jgi:hypothetical protein
MNYSEKLINEIEEEIVQLSQIGNFSYTDEQLKKILNKVGCRIELYFKSILFPLKSSRKNFEYFIDLLSTYSVSQSIVDIFHELRKKYNSAKHDPKSSITRTELIGLLKQIKQCFIDLEPFNIGESNNDFNQEYKRTFWVTVYDHILHGDSEIQIVLPVDERNYIPNIDLFYIDMSDWDKVKNDLSIIGSVFPGKTSLHPDIYGHFKNMDIDFWDIIAFEGTYKSLISTISEYHIKYNNMIPMLKREFNLHRILQSIIMATMDAVFQVANQDVINIQVFTEQIKNRSINDYGVDSQNINIDELIEDIYKMLTKIDINNWLSLSGPIYINYDDFNVLKKDALVIHEKFPIAIDKNYDIKLATPYDSVNPDNYFDSLEFKTIEFK